jgi:superfamily II DNA/RNA helicase
LNLQTADTVINLDLPWNPAILDQRIGRAHRMGQTKNVQVFLLVTADTIEERLLELIGAKTALALATLDLDNDTDFVEMSAGIDALKNRLEILLGKKPDLETKAPETRDEVQIRERREKISEAGEKLLDAVCGFVGELLPRVRTAPGNGNGGEPREETDHPEAPEKPNPAEAVKGFLQSLVQKDENGRPRISFTLPDDAVLAKMAETVTGFIRGFF